MKPNWKYISVYLVIALGFSFLVNQVCQIDLCYSSVKDTFLSNSCYLLAGLSTAIGGTLMLIFHKGVSNRITVLGEARLKNILIALLPVFAFSLVGLNNNYGMSIYLYGFLYALVNTLYAFAEEFGWRRYLQNALEPKNKHIKYLFIGVVWWVWHFRFNTQFDLFIFPFICIGGGYLLGKLADDVKSILPVVAMHTLIILTTNSGNFGKHEIMGIGIVIVGWVVIERVVKLRLSR